MLRQLLLLRYKFRLALRDVDGEGGLRGRREVLLSKSIINEDCVAEFTVP